jgi:lipid A 3-O-deacylase
LSKNTVRGKRVEVLGFPPISQNARNGWGTELLPWAAKSTLSFVPIRREETLIRGGRVFLLVLLVGVSVACVRAQSRVASNGSAVDAKSSITDPALTGSDVARLPGLDPVAEVRKNQSWEFGPFVNGGVGLGNRDDFGFFSAGFQGGKVLTPVIQAGIFSGQFELGANIMPLWQAYTPPPNPNATFIFPCATGTCYFVGPEGGGTFTGASITPVILRWNFLTRSRRFQPWFQAAGGLIYTTHKFPPDQLVPHGNAGGTSVFNFSPQGGGGFHLFTSAKRSIDVGVNGVHISSASLGDRNPGVNASIQVQVGYTFWK